MNCTRMFEAARVAHELQQLGIDYTVAVSLPIPQDFQQDFPKEFRLADARYYCGLFGIPPEKVEMIQDDCPRRHGFRPQLPAERPPHRPESGIPAASRIRISGDAAI